MSYKLISEYNPTGDQPEAIKQLIHGLHRGMKHQTLLGVTGSGKTYTIANVIEKINKPVLVLSHNKTLAAQLYGEFKEFFPENAVEYFVSYYDYYQPEAYMPVTDTYIEKDLSINEEIEKLRLSTTSSLISGRRDIIVVSSVSCIYGIGNPDDFHQNTIDVKIGDNIGRDNLLRKLVDSLYFRSEIDFKRGSFRVNGDTVDIFLPYHDIAIKIVFWDEEVEEISSFDPYSAETIKDLGAVKIYPANIFVTTKSRVYEAIKNIQDDMTEQVDYLKSIGKNLEARRIYERVNFDIEMFKELGYCSGIENYSRYFDGRKPGTPPFCLLDYFPKDFLMIIDESHVTIPQIKGMYGGDRSRKENLVNYGFRLPAALDNRPLKFDEFEERVNQVIYVSATPADYELEKTGGIIVEQIIRPTGLPDPLIFVRPTGNQIDDLMNEISIRIDRNEKILITTLTKRMAEELSGYLSKHDVKTRYIHSDVDTIERVKILAGLREGEFDVIVGVNLLREGLDLPEVSLVAILDADKEGFLRSERSLTQTAGRAARNLNGKVIMYADKITDSMRRTIDETNRRREKQLKYNEINNITPTQIYKAQRDILGKKGEKKLKEYQTDETIRMAADPVIKYMDINQLEKSLKHTKKLMENAASKLDFVQATKYRDEMYELERILKEKKE